MLLTRAPTGQPAPAVVALRAHLTERAAAAFEHLREACDPGRARRLLSRLARSGARPRVASRRGHGGLPSRERRRLARGVIDRARDLGVAVADAGAILIVERVHEVRIAAKRLRYALELTGELRLVRTASLVASLRAVQDMLGELHDLDVLRDRCGRGCVRERAAGLHRGPGSRTAIATTIDADIRLLHARYLRGARALAAPHRPRRDRSCPMPGPFHLYLVRHAVAEERGPAWPDDSQRPLTDGRREEVAAAGRRARRRSRRGPT